ncbi:MAG: flagellar type III secretion system pore protein FliP [Planctomycetota bacterium]
MIRVLAVLLAALLAAALPAQSTPQGGAANQGSTIGTQVPQAASASQQQPGATNPGTGPSLSLNLSGGSTEPESLGNALEIVLMMTLLSLAPSIVLTMTCFTRIVIVMSFLKRALALQELPPAPVVTGFALFLSIFIMKPVVMDMHDDAYQPYVEREIDFAEAADRAASRMKSFMLKQTRADDLRLVAELSDDKRPSSRSDIPLHVVIPAFILSEIKTAFQMGFVLFLPFVVIDLVVAAILVSMGMFTLPPVVISTPLKLLLFVMVDGWNLVVASLAESFANS